METEIQASKSYRDLVVWRKSIDLAKHIYLATECFPKSEIYGLVNQLRRASVSVPSNIAEGQARRSPAEFVHFLHISVGSLAEIDTQLIIAEELGYLPPTTATELSLEIVEIRKMLFGLINHYETKKHTSENRS